MKPLITDEFWSAVEPLIPPPKRRRRAHPGRKPIDRRKILTGIVFVHKTGIAWSDRPAELGFGWGKTCRADLDAWQKAGVWDRRHRLLLSEWNGADGIDGSRAAIDSSSARSPSGGEATGPDPTDRRTLGTKHHAIVDG
jgi:transposase